jgi:CRP-like cAMP-binding protein
MYELILKNVRQYIQLTDEEEKYFLTVLKPRVLRKRQFLLQEGDVCKHETFVTKGLLRAYAIDNKGQEHVTMFAQEGWWISDFYSLLSGSAASMNIDALEDTTVLQIEINDLNVLYERVEKFNKFFRVLLQNAFISHQQRILTIMSATAEERYLAFIKKYPGLDQRVAQHQIASFLGVTPETISRVRRQMLEKGILKS